MREWQGDIYLRQYRIQTIEGCMKGQIECDIDVKKTLPFAVAITKIYKTWMKDITEFGESVNRNFMKNLYAAP